MAAIAPPSLSPPPLAERSDAWGEPNGNAESASPAGNRPAGGTGAGGEAESNLLGSGAWPALSESTRASSSSPSKSSPESPVEDFADRLSELSISKETESDKEETPSHIIATRQRSIRGNGALPNGVAPASTSTFESQQSSPASRSGHQHARKSPFTNRGPHIRAAGFHYQPVGHEQQRGYQQWHSREWHSHQDGGFDPRFMRPVPPLPLPLPFPHHPLIQPQAFPFGNPLTYPEMAPPFFPALPLDIEASSPFPVLPPPPVYSALHFDILRQIEYYFSKGNLIKDLHFRKEWNGEGWVHISIIAAFKKVSNMTRDINLILNAIQASTILEIQGEMVRKRGDWERWLVPKDFKISSDSGPPVQ